MWMLQHAVLEFPLSGGTYVRTNNHTIVGRYDGTTVRRKNVLEKKILTPLKKF